MKKIKNSRDLEFHSIQEELMKAQMYQQTYKYDDALKIYNQILNIQRIAFQLTIMKAIFQINVDKAIECYQKHWNINLKAQVAW